MQQDNNLTNKLQQLEKQQLPDLSQMDKHWEQMKADLQLPGKNAGKTFPKKGIWFIAAICLLGIAVLLNNQFSKKENTTAKLNEPKEIIPEQKIATGINISDTNIVTGSDNTLTNPGYKKSIRPTVVKNKVISAPKNKASKTADIITKPSPDTNAVQEPGNNIDQTVLVKSFFDQLKKPIQEFVINNSTDTLLECKEGAALLIPSNSLGGGQVKITVTEFYKRSDIVINKLTTTSDGIRLESGGMLHIAASKDGKPVKQTIDNPIKFYLSDTSANIQGMQLFTGEENKKRTSQPVNWDTAATVMYDDVNWIAQPQYFRNVQTLTEVRVLDLSNEPFKTIKRRKGIIGVFNIVSHPELSKSALKKVLKEKYGYYKVRFGFRENAFFHGRLSSKIDSIIYSDIPVGDSVWMLKAKADKYGLVSTASRSYEVNKMQEIFSTDGRLIGTYSYNNDTRDGKLFSTLSADVLNKVKDRYSVDITSLGWINCDRFSNDMRPKINYVIDLGDKASNYYTVLVFDKMKSIINGMVSGKKVLFTNMPLGEPVKIISIGIDKNGQPVMAMKQAIISKETVGGLQFESSSAPAIKASLSKMD